ncbi:MAG: bifunctional ADP-dependent NAD(P)H-hydrate dehydratase/NAD(P)H-hydrate epimerase [Chloroflexi bacterium CG23_combo_of_CG06-09_8_20_14_all_45_10]|nr:MAG: bifunctional ADP-dependent NAD(P)H-hydrate dehydratase/NAD(P)H-hydrate epimerase [Chloroflexi bacterium CG23_combo_of_CG06-09_8_20_14_all_45_10]
MKVSTVAQMGNLDMSATEEFGISQDLLMENAGQAVYFVILKEFGVKNKKFAVFCGTGNNGGDGLVVARKIHSNGGEAKVFLLDDEAKFKGAAEKNFEIASKMPIEISKVSSIESVKIAVLNSDAIVDAIFGTGLIREVSGIYKDVIQLINESKKTVFSVDIPSGINGDTAEVMGIAVKANYTITFGLPKIGNMLYPGYDHCGKLYVSHISFPPSLYNADSIRVEINNPIELPKRSKDAHKGDFGEVLFIAGASSYLGAPYFSALSFLKAGGGYSRLATPVSISSFLANKGSEIVFVPQKETLSGSIALENKDNLLELSERVDMVVMGPGLSLNGETQELVRQLAQEIKKPLLIDGDGITAISKDIEIIKNRKTETILTPHMGEMSRMTKMEISELNKNKIGVSQRTAKELNAMIVLKGAHSLIGYPDGEIFINTSGNPGMATAGSGDVLTGTIAAMFGLGLSLREAVRIGVFMHGFSGDLAAKDKGEDGITAQDILDYLPTTLKRYREDFDEISENLYESIFIV